MKPNSIIYHSVHHSIIQCFIGLHILRIIAPFLSDHINLWGLHLYRYLPLPVSLGCIAISSLLLYPPILQKIASQAHAAGIALHKSKSIRMLFWITLWCIAGYGFWSMRVIPYVHDGIALLADVNKVFLNSVSDYIAYRPQEWLSALLYNQLGQYMENNNKHMADGYYLVASVFGTCAMSIYWMIARELFTDRSTRFFTALTMCSGVIFLIYCGFVEYTTPELFSGTIFCWLGLRYLRTGKGWWWPMVVFPVVFSFHMESVILAPGLLFIAAHRFPEINRVLLQIYRLEYPRALFGGLLLLALWFVYAPPTAFLDRFTVGGNDAWGGIQLFSLAHWMDIGNLILFGAPAAFFVTIIHRKSLLTMIRSDDRAAFLCMISVTAAFMMLITPLLGINWDAASLTFLVWTILGLIFITNLPATKFQQRQTIALVATQTLILTLPALLVYTDEPNATRQLYYVSAQAANRSPVEESIEPEMLRFKYFYYVKSDQQACEQIADRFLNADKAALTHFSLWEVARLFNAWQNTEYELKLRERDIPRLLANIQQTPDDWSLYHILATQCYRPLGKYSEAAEAAQKALDLFPENSDLMALVGIIYCDLRQPENALAPMKQALLAAKSRMDFTQYRYWTIEELYLFALSEVGKFDEIKQYLKENADNQYPAHHFFNGLLASKDSHHDECIQHYMQFRDTRTGINSSCDALFHGIICEQLAQLYLHRKEYEKVIKEIIMLEYIRNNSRFAKYISALIYSSVYYNGFLAAKELGIANVAKQYLEKAIAFDPNNIIYKAVKHEYDKNSDSQ
jgi:tetratricopeptide (TPR) repeat protein